MIEIMRNALLAMLFLLGGTAAAQTDGPWADNLFQEGKKVPALVHDFGSVPRGTLLHHRFNLKNIYAVPLDVSVSVGCHCVSVTPQTQTLLPPSQQEGQPRQEILVSGLATSLRRCSDERKT